MGLGDMLGKAQTSAIDFERFQALSSKMWKNLADLQEITKQEKEGKPINIKRAREIVAEVDEFDMLMKRIPGVGMAAKLGGMKKVISGAHKHLAELEEKVKVQGEYIEPEIVSAEKGPQTPKIEKT
jgi:peptide deformylase